MRMAHTPMSDADALAFLASLPAHTGKLATTRLDGSPHIAPIWFVVDDDGSIVCFLDLKKSRNDWRISDAEFNMGMWLHRFRVQ